MKNLELVLMYLIEYDSQEKKNKQIFYLRKIPQ